MAIKIPVRYNDPDFPRQHGRIIDLSDCLLTPYWAESNLIPRDRDHSPEDDGEFPNASNIAQSNLSDVWNGLPDASGFEAEVETVEESTEPISDISDRWHITPIAVASPVISNERKRNERLENERSERKDNREWKYFFLSILLSLFRRFVFASAEIYQRLERRLYALKRGAFYDEPGYDKKWIFYVALSLPAYARDYQTLRMLLPLMPEKHVRNVLRTRKDMVASHERLFGKK